MIVSRMVFNGITGAGGGLGVRAGLDLGAALGLVDIGFALVGGSCVDEEAGAIAFSALSSLRPESFDCDESIVFDADLLLTGDLGGATGGGEPM